MAFGARSNPLSGPSRGALAVPISLVNESAGAATTINGLADAGEFIPALATSQSALSGSLARSVNWKATPPQPIGSNYEFSRTDSHGVLLMTWMPDEKRKGIPVLRLYDLDNRLLTETPTKKKINVNPNRLSYTSWELTLATLPPGVYRLDVSFAGEIVWRTFFRMVE